MVGAQAGGLFVGQAATDKASPTSAETNGGENVLDLGDLLGQTTSSLASVVDVGLDGDKTATDTVVSGNAALVVHADANPGEGAVDLGLASDAQGGLMGSAGLGNLGSVVIGTGLLIDFDLDQGDAHTAALLKVAASADTDTQAAQGSDSIAGSSVISFDSLDAVFDGGVFS